MHTSKLAWRLAALVSVAAAGCGDDTSTPDDDGDGGGGAATTTSSSTTTSASSSGGGDGGDGPTTTGATTTSGGEGGDGGAGGAAPMCGDGVAEGDEACDGDDVGGATCEGLGFWFGAVTCSDDCVVVTAGCAGLEVCDDGADNDLDGRADCSDAACLGDPGCDGDGEVSCSDLDDEDDDGLVDCADPDCQATAACAPGAGTPGAPCTASVDCASAAGADPLCLSSALTDGLFLGGYCSEHCDPVAQDCGAGSVCLEFGFAFCVASCENAGDCGPGQDCVDADDQAAGRVCFPIAGDDEICDNDLDDDGDGFVDCTDVTCSADLACAAVELQCSNLEDDDADASFDCADATACWATVLCQPGDRPLGAPCSHNTECASSTDQPLCILELFPNGACSSWCTTDDDCGPGGACVPALGAGVCLERCEALFDCFPGAICASEDVGDVCIPVDGELCGNERDDDGDDVVDCDDDDCEGTLACTTPEADCANLEDDDEDGYIDCADATGCAATPTCDPGDGEVGAACDAPGDCASESGDDPLCLPASEGFPGGYCSEFCDPAAQDCAAGAVCAGDGLRAVCLAGCAVDDDCNDGYECAVVDADTLGCIPVAVE